MARPKGSFARKGVARTRSVRVPQRLWDAPVDLGPFNDSRAELLCQALECLAGERGDARMLLSALGHDTAEKATKDKGE